ncbi:MAG TPA: hypothetical protein VNG31_02810, partial [Candidatus Baltobacteraceae bacterium]|nr:hypothetical protein [Candidatus Baltobacteraceae bacterium]
ESTAHVERVNEVVTAMGQLGLPTVRHVASPATTPGYVLQLVGQLEATFARLIFVAVGENDLLRAMLDAASSYPVLDGRADMGRLTLQCSKMLGLEDTVLYGRTLLMQANARSNVVHADASLQHQAQLPQGAVLG